MNINLGLIIKSKLHIQVLVSVLSLLLIFYSFGYVFIYWKLNKTFKQTGIGKVRELAAIKSVKNFNFFNPVNNNLPNKEMLNVIKIHYSLTKQNSKNIQFIENKEIRYFGEMFDIIKKRKINDTVYYLCISDKNEDILEKAFLEQFNNDNSTNSKNTPIKSLLKDFEFDWMLPNSNLTSINIQRTNLFIIYQIVSIQNDFEVLTPPPQSNCPC